MTFVPLLPPSAFKSSEEWHTYMHREMERRQRCWSVCAVMLFASFMLLLVILWMVSTGRPLW